MLFARKALLLYLIINDTFDMENKDLNRLKVVLAEKKRTNKWLAEKLSQRPCHCLEMVYQFCSAQSGEFDGDSQMLGSGC